MHITQTLTHEWPLTWALPQASLHQWVEGKSNLKGVKRGSSGRDSLPFALTRYKNYQTKLSSKQEKVKYSYKESNKSEIHFKNSPLVQVAPNTWFIIEISPWQGLQFKIPSLETIHSTLDHSGFLKDDSMTEIKYTIVAFTLDYPHDSTVCPVL